MNKDNIVNTFTSNLAMQYMTKGYSVCNINSDLKVENFISVDDCLLEHWKYILQNQPWSKELLPSVTNVDGELLAVLQGKAEYPATWTKLPWTWHKQYMGYCNDSSAFHLPYQHMLMANKGALHDLCEKITGNQGGIMTPVYDRAFQCLPTIPRSFRSFYVPTPLIPSDYSSSSSSSYSKRPLLVHGNMFLTPCILSIIPCAPLSPKATLDKFRSCQGVPSTHMLKRDQVIIHAQPGDLVLYAPGSIVKRMCCGELKKNGLPAAKSDDKSKNRVKLRLMEIGTNITWCTESSLLDSMVAKRTRNEQDKSQRFTSVNQMTEYATTTGLAPLLSMSDYGKTKFTYLPLQVARRPNFIFEYILPKFQASSSGYTMVDVNVTDSYAKKTIKMNQKPFLL